MVLCPGTISYFDRPVPAITEMWDAGLTIGLGTDSLASNRQLDLFAEMQTLHQLVPDMDPDRILQMATSMGGEAIQIPTAGRLDFGERFDALGFSEAPTGGPQALSHWLVASRPRPDVRFLRGLPSVFHEPEVN